MPDILPLLPQCARINDPLLFIQFTLSLRLSAGINIVNGGFQQLARYELLLGRIIEKIKKNLIIEECRLLKRLGRI
jgi:hypothetical protein